jgi:hypothetical protein
VAAAAAAAADVGGTRPMAGATALGASRKSTGAAFSFLWSVLVDLCLPLLAVVLLLLLLEGVPGVAACLCFVLGLFLE